MMEGVINFLTGSSQEAEFLRDNAIFKIIPMVNPDGVIHGGYRYNNTKLILEFKMLFSRIGFK